MSQQPDNHYESHLRSLRYSLFKDSVRRDTISVLDVGCAGGEMWEGRKTPSVLDGIDSDANMLEIAESKQIYRNLFKSFDDVKVHEYSLVMCCGVLEHVYDYWEFASNMKVAKNLILTVPNAWSFHRIVGVHLGQLPEPTHLHSGDVSIGHRRVFDPEAWRSFITVLAADGKFDYIECGSIGMKFGSSAQMLNFLPEVWNAFDETALDLDLSGENCFYGAELYAILGRL